MRIAVVTALVAGGSAGPAPATRSPTPAVAVVGSVVKVRPTDAVSGSTAASIFAARDEAQSFQVVVAPARPR